MNPLTLLHRILAALRERNAKAARDVAQAEADARAMENHRAAMAEFARLAGKKGDDA